MSLVAGVDSGTQSTKVVVCDAGTGRVLRTGSSPHPDGTEVDPEEWWAALLGAIEAAGGLDDVEALSVAGQQHGMVCLDADGRVVRPALLWNDTRSAQAAADLVDELGEGDREAGASWWAHEVGSVPVASLTVAKLRWLADHEPASVARTAAVALPHDWLTWRLAGSGDLSGLVTDRSDASGTGYLATTGEYRIDLLARALRLSEERAAALVLPRVAAPGERAGSGDPARGWGHLVLGPGCGDNAGAALGLGVATGETFVSIGTSGVVATVSKTPTADASGVLAGFADATGRYLPLACTLNGARVLDATARLLGVDHAGLDALALASPPGADGLVLVPYLEGERTPDLPHARGRLSGLSADNLTPAGLARAAVEGLLGLLGRAQDTIRAQGSPIERVVLVGGGARSRAVRTLAPTVWGVPVDVPEAGADVALGAARQAAWVLSGADAAPRWSGRRVERYDAPHEPGVTSAYARAADEAARLEGGAAHR